jgi:TonB family protein
MQAQERPRNFIPHLVHLLCAVVLGLIFVALASSAQDIARKVTARTAPNYPELAKKMHLSGKVKVEVSINPAGSVTTAKLVGGNPVFELCAVEAVKQWKFEPAANVTKTVIVLEFADQ